MTTPAELSHLKNEVAELWKRFKKDEPTKKPADDPERTKLTAEVRALDVRSRELMTRRDALRMELDHERRKYASRLPVVRGVGLVFGVAAGAIALYFGLEPLAAWTAELPRAAGIAMLVAVVPFPLLIPQLRR
ncbi:MAG: hypothetical protein U0228_11400 [Myxococcaceae bacterium]